MTARCLCRYAAVRVNGHWRQRRVLSAECVVPCEYGGLNPDVATCETAAYVHQAKLLGVATFERYGERTNQPWPADVQARIDVMEPREWWAFSEGFQGACQAATDERLGRRRN